MKNKKIKAWVILYRSFFVGTYKTKKEAETAIRPDPKGYKIVPCEIIIHNKKEKKK